MGAKFVVGSRWRAMRRWISCGRTAMRRSGPIAIFCWDWFSRAAPPCLDWRTHRTFADRRARVRCPTRQRANSAGRYGTVRRCKTFFYVFFILFTFLRVLTFFYLFPNVYYLKNVGKVQSGKQINKKQRNRSTIFPLHVEYRRFHC